MRKNFFTRAVMVFALLMTVTLLPVGSVQAASKLKIKHIDSFGYYDSEKTLTVDFKLNKKVSEKGSSITFYRAPQGSSKWEEIKPDATDLFTFEKDAIASIQSKELNNENYKYKFKLESKKGEATSKEFSPLAVRGLANVRKTTRKGDMVYIPVTIKNYSSAPVYIRARNVATWIPVKADKNGSTHLTYNATLTKTNKESKIKKQSKCFKIAGNKKKTFYIAINCAKKGTFEKYKKTEDGDMIYLTTPKKRTIKKVISAKKLTKLIRKYEPYIYSEDDMESVDFSCDLYLYHTKAEAKRKQQTGKDGFMHVLNLSGENLLGPTRSIYLPVTSTSDFNQ